MRRRRLSSIVIAISQIVFVVMISTFGNCQLSILAFELPSAPPGYDSRSYFSYSQSCLHDHHHGKHRSCARSFNTQLYSYDSRWRTKNCKLTRQSMEFPLLPLYNNDNYRKRISTKNVITSTTTTISALNKNSSIDENGDTYTKLTKSYKLASHLHFIVFLTLLLAPTRTATLLASSAGVASGGGGGGATAAVIANTQSLIAQRISAAFGYAMSSIILYILSNASLHTTTTTTTQSIRSEDPKKHELSNDTNKRLNLSIILYGLGGLFILPGEASFCRTFFGAIAVYTMMTLSKLWAIRIAYRGWIVGGGTLRALLTFWKGRFSHLFRIGLRGYTYKNRNSSSSSSTITLDADGDGEIRQYTVYKLCFILLLFGLWNQIMTLKHLIMHSSTSTVAQAATAAIATTSTTDPFRMSLYVSSIVRLTFLSTIVYNMKDADEHNQINGMTFIQLNTIMGLWAFAVGISQGFIDGSFVVRKSIHMILYSWPFLFKAYSHYKERDEE